MQESKSFVNFVISTACRGYQYDASSCSIKPRVHLDAYTKERLRRGAIEFYGYKTDREADEVVRRIQNRCLSMGAQQVSRLLLADLDEGSHLEIVQADGSRLAAIYRGGNQFIVLQDNTGLLRRGDTLRWLMLAVAVGGRLQAVVFRHGMQFPAEGRGWLSAPIAEINVTNPVPEGDTDGWDDPGDVATGSQKVYTFGPNAEGYFTASMLCGSEDNAPFEIDLATMQYCVSHTFRPGDADRGEVERAVSSACEVERGDNPLRLHTVEPGSLVPVESGSGYVLEIVDKLKVRLD